jgi:hypothetical protein
MNLMLESQTPYPSDFDIDHAASHHEERRRLALKSLDAGDVIATVEDTLAGAADPRQHPLFPLVNWLLDRQLSVDGGVFWDQWKQCCLDAIDRLVEAHLQGED